MKTSKKRHIRALARRVLAVAVEGEIGDWTAYIDAVVGNNHDQEVHEVIRYGNKLPKEFAEILFPTFKHLKWRY